MTTSIMNQYRPMKPVQGDGIINWLKAVNYVYWLQRAPMALLSIPAAYGVAAFASVRLPVPFNWLAGAGFESVYLGCVALADQMYDEDKETTALWWTLNLIAVCVSALINVLFFSNDAFAGFNWEALVHGVPLPVLSFGYSLLLHKVTNRNVAREHKEQQEREKFERENPYDCVCGARFPTGQARRNHRRSCEKYQDSMQSEDVQETVTSVQ